MGRPATAREEWAKYWFLPPAAALGYSTSGLHIYGIGPFLAPLGEAFGWSRAQILSGAAIVSFGVALASMPMGVLLDKWGPRRIGMLGVLLMGAAVALLSTATGSLLNWWMLWAIVAVCATGVQGPVWTSAIVGRFDSARGLALGLTLCGTSIAVFAMPLMSTWLIQHFDWRTAFIGVGLSWAALVLPFLFLFFRGVQDGGAEARIQARADNEALPGMTFAKAVRTVTFYKLLAASGFFALAVVGTIVNFVPILTDKGAAPMIAAGAASMIGLASIAGRLGTGFVLDRFPTHIIAAISFLIPIPGCALLLFDGIGLPGYVGAAIIFGLTLGAETDVITYLATRRFGLKHFGRIQGGLLCAVALGGATGPLLAGAIFDEVRSYAPFLVIMAGLMLTSAILVGTVRGVPKWEE